MNTKPNPAQSPVEFMGVWHYSFFPKGMQLAKASDLFHDSHLPSDKWKPRAGTWYMIESFLTPGTFEACRLSEFATFSDLRPWYSAQKIWIREQA